ATAPPATGSRVAGSLPRSLATGPLARPVMPLRGPATAAGGTGRRLCGRLADRTRARGLGIVLPDGVHRAVRLDDHRHRAVRVVDPELSPLDERLQRSGVTRDGDLAVELARGSVVHD